MARTCVKTAPKRFEVEETLAGCQNVLAVKFTADFAPSFMRLTGKVQFTACYSRRNLSRR
jgi:hypothetical protein